MEDSEEEEDDDNHVPPEYNDAATGGAAEDQEEPDDVPDDAATGEATEDQEESDDVPDDDDLRRVIVYARSQCISQKEKLKFNRMLEDHKKGLYRNVEDGNTGEATENIEEEASKGYRIARQYVRSKEGRMPSRIGDAEDTCMP